MSALLIKHFYYWLGLAFWKANSRKVFAIPAPVKKERSIVCVDDDLTDSDNSDIPGAHEFFNCSLAFRKLLHRAAPNKSFIFSQSILPNSYRIIYSTTQYYAEMN